MTISSTDRGFLLGDALFETVRLYQGRPFLLPEHFKRLRMAAKEVGIPFPAGVLAQVERAMGEWEGKDGALRITLSRGSGSGLLPEEPGPPTLSIGIAAWGPDPRWYEEGLSARLAGRIDERALTAGLKATGYLERIQALRIARQGGADEAILRNTKGLLTEGTASNLFVYSAGRVIAPGKPSGALEGITRERILDLLEREGVPVQKRGVPQEEAGAAEEIFLSSSLRELVPVVRLEGGPVGAGVPGPLFKLLLEGYQMEVRSALEES